MDPRQERKTEEEREKGETEDKREGERICSRKENLSQSVEKIQKTE